MEMTELSEDGSIIEESWNTEGITVAYVTMLFLSVLQRTLLNGNWKHRGSESLSNLAQHPAHRRWDCTFELGLKPEPLAGGIWGWWRH